MQGPLLQSYSFHRIRARRDCPGSLYQQYSTDSV